MQCAEQHGSAFNQQVVVALVSQIVQQRCESDAPGSIWRELHNPHATGLHGSQPGWLRLNTGDERLTGKITTYHTGVQRCLAATINNDPQGVAWFAPVLIKARRQLRIIIADSANTHHNHIHLIAQAMHLGTGCRIGDPTAITTRSGNTAIERHGVLGGHQWPTTLHPTAKRSQLPGYSCRSGRDPVHLDPGRLQHSGCPVSHARIGIVGNEEDPPDPGGDDRLSAGRRAPVEGAWFERGVEVGPACPLTGCGQGYPFGVWTTGGLGCAKPNYLPITHNHRPNRRIGAGATDNRRRLLQSQFYGIFERENVWLMVHRDTPEHTFGASRRKRQRRGSERPATTGAVAKTDKSIQ
jgi:hypothetical protein